jgi:ferritin
MDLLPALASASASRERLYPEATRSRGAIACYRLRFLRAYRSGDRYSGGKDVAEDEKEEITLLGTAIEEAMNEQIKNELFSAYQYLSMAAYCESENLPGFARWMRTQAQEETGHAMKFYDFILERNGRVALRAIDGPVVEFGSPLEVFEEALEHERRVTAMIHDLYGLAVGENDYASQTFLQWFVTEQVEEEKNAGDVVETLKMVGDKSEALFLLDRELGQRRAEEEPAG